MSPRTRRHHLETRMNRKLLLIQLVRLLPIGVLAFIQSDFVIADSRMVLPTNTLTAENEDVVVTHYHSVTRSSKDEAELIVESTLRITRKANNALAPDYNLMNRMTAAY